MSIDWNRILRETDHRPWPLPERPWVMTMSWLDLFLAHWPVDTGYAFEMNGEPAAAHYADRLDVLGWWPSKIRVGEALCWPRQCADAPE